MNYSLYFHIPFCVHRCAYCDFNTYAGKESLIPAYVDALVQEIRLVAASAPEHLPVHTIFFGGGTPSLLSSSLFEQILTVVRQNFDLVPPQNELHEKVADVTTPRNMDARMVSTQPGPVVTPETSLEANPGTVSLDGLKDLRKAGFNRLSLGVQSAHPEELRQLERIHDFYDVIDSVKWARQAGFGNLNLDLIYGLPSQSLARWQESLHRAVALGPEHLSLYALTIEHGTPFGHWMARGLMPLADPDLAADMYDWASDYLKGEGYEQYEISNWSRPGFQCQHNLQYWRNQPYLGFGAGAHGCAAGQRISNLPRIKTYIDRLSEGIPPRTAFPVSPVTVSREHLTRTVEMQETMLLGLRLTKEGVSTRTFRDRFGADLQTVFAKEITELLGLGLLEWILTETDRRIHLSSHGRLLGNQVFIRFVGV